MDQLLRRRAGLRRGAGAGGRSDPPERRSKDQAADDDGRAARGQPPHLIVTAVPIGINFPSVRIAALVRRTQPWDTRPGIRPGWLVP